MTSSMILREILQISKRLKVLNTQSWSCIVLVYARHTNVFLWKAMFWTLIVATSRRELSSMIQFYKELLLLTGFLKTLQASLKILIWHLCLLVMLKCKLRRNNHFVNSQMSYLNWMIMLSKLGAKSNVIQWHSSLMMHELSGMVGGSFLLKFPIYKRLICLRGNLLN